jgi:quinoprotein glucose dehydrogenase
VKKNTRFLIASAGVWLALSAAPARAAEYQLFARSNLLAWCIVPFDAKQRGPAERAEMVKRVGLPAVAYDWRPEHVPQFEQEILEYQKHGLRYFAFWGQHDEAYRLFEKYQMSPQFWVMIPKPTAATQDASVKEAAGKLLATLQRAAKLGSQVGLYNHGGWGGEPENMVAVCRELRAAHGVTNVGIIYNLHHGHDHVDRLPAALAAMKPFLLCLNLNGMTRDGEKRGKKIIPLGSGELDLGLLKVIRNSGYRGPIGILGHTQNDAEEQLRDNLDGLDWLLPQLDGKPAGPKPKFRTERADAGSSRGNEALTPAAIRSPEQSDSLLTSAPTRSGIDYWAVEDAVARAKLPLYQTIPAAMPSELTPALPDPKAESFRSWSRSLGDSGSRRYSALTQINRDNVAQLEVAWTYHSKDGKGNIQANPVIVDGVMFAPTVGDFIVAVDAATGVERWRFKPEIVGRKRLEDNAARRGLVYWSAGVSPAVSKSKDAAGRLPALPPRLIFPTGNWLYALDPKTGKPIAEFGENGRARIPAACVVAPAIFKNVIVVPGFAKDVFGYDLASGKLLWTFHTIPQPGEFGHDTWDKPNQGANCWGGMALDEQRGIAFITTGSPKPNFIGTPHRGDNLFANCVIALDALTGKRLWHFQEIRHDIWDLDLPAPPNLITVTRDGRRVDAVAATTKIGNTLLLDRVTGKPLFPFRLRRAPTSKLPGEQTAPYQPALELPQPFARQSFSTNDVTDISPEARAAILNKVKFANTGWFEHFEENKPTIFYGLHGGAEWTGAAVDAATGWLYVTANELPWQITVTRAGGLRPKNTGTPGEAIYKLACVQCHGEQKEGVGVAPPLLALEKRMKDADVLALMKTGRNLMPVAPELTPQQQRDLMDFVFDRDLPASVLAKRDVRGERPEYVFAGYPKLLDPENYPGVKPPWGTLNAMDLNTGKLVWKVPLGEYPELTARGIPVTGTENFGGAMVTAGGLVFAGGTRDECLRAFDAKTGAELWKHKLPFGGVAPPATYEVNGRQYVVIAATGGGKLGLPTGDAYVAFALPKK